MIIVLTGHGIWNPKSSRAPYVTLPARCSFHFYTQNFTLMTETYGQELEQGVLDKQSAIQKTGPFQSVQNMVLTWPRGLRVMKPPSDWHEIEWETGVTIPSDGKSIQFRIKKPDSPLSDLLADPLGHLHLDEILTILDPALRGPEDKTIVWAACRENKLSHTLPPREYRFNREGIPEFIEDCELEGITISEDLRLKMLGFHGQRLTLEKLSQMIGFDELSPTKWDTAKRWRKLCYLASGSTMMPHLDQEGLRYETENLLVNKRPETYVPLGFTMGRVAPPLPSKAGRPHLKQYARKVR